MMNIAIQEHISLLAMRSDWGTKSHFNVLLESYHSLRIGATKAADKNALSAAEIAKMALLNLADRAQSSGAYRASEAETKAIALMIEAAQDFWKRKSGALFVWTFDELRRQQRAANASN